MNSKSIFYLSSILLLSFLPIYWLLFYSIHSMWAIGVGISLLSVLFLSKIKQTYGIIGGTITFILFLIFLNYQGVFKGERGDILTGLFFIYPFILLFFIVFSFISRKFWSEISNKK